MFERLKELVLKWLGIKLGDEPQRVEEYARRYEDIRAENITAIIAGKLATLTFGDSTLTVEGDGRRVELIRGLLTRLWTNDAQWITAQMLGKGGKVIVPTVSGGGIHLSAIDQSRLRIIEQRGDKITAALLHIDSTLYNEHRYDLYAEYTLSGGTQAIRYRITQRDSGKVEIPFGDFKSALEGPTATAQIEDLRRRAAEIEPGVLPAWQLAEPEITIANTDRLLIAYLRCPRYNRRDGRRYGVPITYGAERLLDELAEHANVYRREFRLTRPMLGLDSTLWQRTAPGQGIREIKKTVQDSDDPFIPLEASLTGSAPWQYYAPAIRQDAMEQRYQSLCRRVEKACGLSQGILTERQTMNYANRDEVRAAQYDTFSVVRAVRDAWEAALDDIVYALDVLAERYSLTPAGGRGQASVSVDWDQSLIESTQQTFEQMSELQSRGMVSSAELRQWVMGGSLEEAQQAVDEIKASAPPDPMLSALRQPEPEEE